MENKNYFIELEMIECDVEKKNWLNYISWSDWWAELKKVHPTATYRKIKNWDTYLFKSWTGWSVECEVTVWDVTHCADLAITDFKNQEIKYDLIKSTDIQNTLQRAFAKAIAMHWIGLYVYRGEDFPEDDDGNTANEAKRTTKEIVQEKKWFNYKDLKQCIADWTDTEVLLSNYIKDNWYTISGDMKICLRTYCDSGELVEPVRK